MRMDVAKPSLFTFSLVVNEYILGKHTYILCYFLCYHCYILVRLVLHVLLWNKYAIIFSQNIVLCTCSSSSFCIITTISQIEVKSLACPVCFSDNIIIKIGNSNVMHAGCFQCIRSEKGQNVYFQFFKSWIF